MRRMNNHEKHSMNLYLRAADYLTAAQLFLAEDHLLKHPVPFTTLNPVF